MAATVATPVTAAELDPDRCGSDEESHGAEAEEESSRQQTGPAAAAVTHNRLSKLPLARIKALMKTDPDVSLASQESVFIIAKATELFVEMIAKDALVYAQQGKRKTLQRKDLDNAIEAIDEFAFLEGKRCQDIKKSSRFKAMSSNNTKEECQRRYFVVQQFLLNSFLFSLQAH
ncbi:hypothetical protein PAMA_001439 [Pampus argenteus]